MDNALIDKGLVKEVPEQGAVSVPTDMPHSLPEALDIIDQLRKAVSELSHQATTDPLTGEWNRRRIEESARQELLRHTRYGHPASVIFIDLDLFKKVNDTYGHVVGDFVLKEFCAVARHCMRSTDMLGRWGGEEFVIIMPNSGLAVARMLAERIRRSLPEHHFQPVERVTASFGVTDCTEQDSVESWLARADKAVYRAKALGRNRVEVTAADPATATIGDRIDTGFIRLHWRKAYESGHPVIDVQHRALFDHADSILIAVIANQPPDQVGPMITQLLADVATHFQDEEQIMRDSGYPGLATHAAVHRKLHTQAGVLAAKFACQTLPLGELFEFLANAVIAHHMLTEDRKFFAYLWEKDLAIPPPPGH